MFYYYENIKQIKENNHIIIMQYILILILIGGLYADFETIYILNENSNIIIIITSLIISYLHIMPNSIYYIEYIIYIFFFFLWNIRNRFKLIIILFHVLGHNTHLGYNVLRK